MAQRVRTPSIQLALRSHITCDEEDDRCQQMPM
jgi:hypothetical protein